MDLSIIIRITSSHQDGSAAIESLAPLDTLSYEVLLIDDSLSGIPLDALDTNKGQSSRWLRASTPTPSRPGLARNEAVFYEATGRYLFFSRARRQSLSRRTAASGVQAGPGARPWRRYRRH